MVKSSVVCPSCAPDTVLLLPLLAFRFGLGMLQGDYIPVLGVMRVIIAITMQPAHHLQFDLNDTNTVSAKLFVLPRTPFFLCCVNLHACHMFAFVYR